MFEIELIELLKKRSFTKKKEILAMIWKYSDDADTHTVETHIYRLRKKIKEIFNDETFIKSEKKGYTIWKKEINLQKTWCHQNTDQELLNLKRVKEVLKEKRKINI